MDFKSLFFPVILFLGSLQNSNGKELQTVKDLKPLWKIFTANKLNDFNAQSTKSIHLSLDLTEDNPRFLRIESSKCFYLFINSIFITKSHKLHLSADSLKRRYSTIIFISIYQPYGIVNLETSWVSTVQDDLLFNPKRPTDSFSNFILVASLVLIIFFTVLFRTNPQLTLDYFDFTKLFLFRDREESQITLRITSSVNLLFYLFCSLLTSLAVMTTSHFSAEGLSILTRSPSFSTNHSIVQWLFIAFTILGLLMAKLAFGAILALLYNWKDVAGFQFFNFVRVLIFSLALIGLAGIFCFSLNINANYFNLLKAGCFLLALGVGLLFFKLRTRTSFRSFHLFSYLCATEIFPLMILIKVLLF
jgi:hypothetical protein